jgi:hypothetical protein
MKKLTDTETYQLLSFVPVTLREIMDSHDDDSASDTLEKLRWLVDEVHELVADHPETDSQTVEYALEDIAKAVSEVKPFNPWS